MGLDLNTSNYHQRWLLLPLARQWAAELHLDLNEQELGDWAAALRDELSPPLNANRVVGSLGNIVASRVAREFGFGGPSFAVSAEEASGLRALDIAVHALQNHELDSAVVGAVDLCGDVRSVLAGHALRPFSASGHVRPFDASADGTVVGEGAVALVLKRLPDALADNDRVYAVVRGLGFSGGDLPGEPTTRAYTLALERAYADASPDSVQYIEAHGSGTPEEDRIETDALAAWFQKRPAQRTIGSTKTNVGHTGAAAGLTSIVKAALSLHRNEIPPLAGTREQASCETLRNQTLSAAGFQFPHVAAAWPGHPDTLRRAGVSTIAVDGNCAHIVLEAVDLASQTLEPRAGKSASSSAHDRHETKTHITVSTGAPVPRPQLPQHRVDRLKTGPTRVAAAPAETVAAAPRGGRSSPENTAHKAVAHQSGPPEPDPEAPPRVHPLAPDINSDNWPPKSPPPVSPPPAPTKPSSISHNRRCRQPPTR